MEENRARATWSDAGKARSDATRLVCQDIRQYVWDTRLIRFHLPRVNKSGKHDCILHE